MAIKKGLGRSFDSLIPTELLDESFDPTADQDDQVSDLRNIKISEIEPDENQPRRRFDDAALNELAESIRVHGILQPIVVTAKGGKYQIVAGERRYRAAKLAGLDKVPALVRTMNGQHRLEISLIENLQRADLNPIEVATAYLKLRDQFSLTLEQVGERVGGRSISSISNSIRLLKLPDFVRQKVAEGVVNEGQVRPLIELDEAQIKLILPRIISESWSARKVEQYIVQLKKVDKSDNEKSAKVEAAPFAENTKRIHARLMAPVEVKTSARGTGHIMIRFKDEAEFYRIADLLEGK